MLKSYLHLSALVPSEYAMGHFCVDAIELVTEAANKALT